MKPRIFDMLYRAILYSTHVHIGWLWRRGPRALHHDDLVSAAPGKDFGPED